MKVADLSPGDKFYMDGTHVVREVRLFTPNPYEFDDWRGLPHWIVETDRQTIAMHYNATVSETWL